MKKTKRLFRIDARTSDAVALALRMNAPIFFMKRFSNRMPSKTERKHHRPYEEATKPDKDELLQEDTIGILKTALQKAIEEEDYERAAQIRDQINQLKNNL